MRSRGFRVGSLLACVLALVFFRPASGQIPDRFTNLKVLPKDISKQDLVETMRGFSRALGEHCGHCHARGAGGTDWASDEKPEKTTARVMIRMVQNINTEQLSHITTHDPDRVSVRCETCHRGQARPWLIEDVLTAAFKSGGVDSLRAKYESLRQRYYGSDTYNFSEGVLPTLAERLAGPDNPRTAVDVAQINLRWFPDSGYTYLVMGQALANAGERETAIADLKKAIQLDPNLKETAERTLQGLEAP